MAAPPFQKPALADDQGTRTQNENAQNAGKSTGGTSTDPTKGTGYYGSNQTLDGKLELSSLPGFNAEAPFSKVSGDMMNAARNAELTIYNEADSLDGIWGTTITQQNGYYIRNRENPSYGKANFGDLGTLNPKINGSILADCSAGTRGRVFELLNSQTMWTKNGGWWGGKFHERAPFNLQQDTPVVPGSEFKLYKDTAGEYGIKDGLWGRRMLKDNPPILPGCIIDWWYEYGVGHMAFVEAVYNFGTDKEYIVISHSIAGQFVHKLEKMTKAGTMYNGCPYVRQRDHYKNTKHWILYTPLCNFGDGSNLDITRKYTYDPKLPDVDQEKAAEYLNQIIEKGGAESNKNIKLLDIIEGDFVEIQWIGYLDSDGLKRRVNRIGMYGWVQKIDKDKRLPYGVFDRASGGNLIGYYDRRSLKVYF